MTSLTPVTARLLPPLPPHRRPSLPGSTRLARKSTDSTGSSPPEGDASPPGASESRSVALAALKPLGTPLSSEMKICRPQYFMDPRYYYGLHISTKPTEIEDNLVYEGSTLCTYPNYIAIFYHLFVERVGSSFRRCKAFISPDEETSYCFEHSHPTLSFIRKKLEAYSEDSYYGPAMKGIYLCIIQGFIEGCLSDLQKLLTSDLETLLTGFLATNTLSKTSRKKETCEISTLVEELKNRIRQQITEDKALLEKVKNLFKEVCKI